MSDKRAQFQRGDAQALDLPSGSRDAAVSGLVINFVPDREEALTDETGYAQGRTRPFTSGTIRVAAWSSCGLSGQPRLRWIPLRWN